jgi:hypothetical protein
LLARYTLVPFTVRFWVPTVTDLTGPDGGAVGVDVGVGVGVAVGVGVGVAVAVVVGVGVVVVPLMTPSTVLTWVVDGRAASHCTKVVKFWMLIEFDAHPEQMRWNTSGTQPPWSFSAWVT